LTTPPRSTRSATRAANPFALPTFLTEAEVAERLAISPRTLQTWRYKGGGPRYLKVGSAVRYRPEDVAAWLERQTRANTADPGLDADYGAPMEPKKNAPREGGANYLEHSQDSAPRRLPRADELKQAIDPAAFYAAELPESWASDPAEWAAQNGADGPGGRP